MDTNIAAALAYVWFVAILWLVLEPYSKDRFIRFHSFQALAFGVVAFVINVILGFIPILGFLVSIPLDIVLVLIWAFCIFKAFSREWFKLPAIGDWAMQQAGPQN